MANTNKSRFKYGKTGGLPAPRLGSGTPMGVARPGYSEKKVKASTDIPKVARPGWAERKPKGGGDPVMARPGYAEKITGAGKGK